MSASLHYLDFMAFTNTARQIGDLHGNAFAQVACRKNLTDCWGDPKQWDTTQVNEHYGVATIDGEQWLTLTMLGPHKVKTVKAIVTRAGVAQDVKCEHGHPYALLDFVPHTVEVWLLVDDLRCYWKASYRPVMFTNPLLGPRLCVEQSEVWAADDYHGNYTWTRGGPLPVHAKPYHGDTPIPIVTESAWFQGLNGGPAYVMGEIKDGARVVTSCATSNGWEF